MIHSALVVDIGVVNALELTILNAVLLLNSEADSYWFQGKNDLCKYIL